MVRVEVSSVKISQERDEESVLNSKFDLKLAFTLLENKINQ